LIHGFLLSQQYLDVLLKLFKKVNASALQIYSIVLFGQCFKSAQKINTLNFAFWLIYKN